MDFSVGTGGLASGRAAAVVCRSLAGLGRVLCQLVKTMHSTFERPQSLGEEIAIVYNMF